MTGTWLRGLLRRRRGALVATASGIAVAVALLASLGAFLAASKATMTARAASGVVVDWQVQAAAGADPAAVLEATRRAEGVTAALPVQFATTDGFTATAGGTQQSTGAGVVLGLPSGYRTVFPGEIRTLSGSPDGVLVAQQTASNLHVAPGDKVTVARAGLPSVTVTVAGVVDLPYADSLFQKVGAPPQSQPAAPPDNVMLMPATTFASTMTPLSATRPDLVTTQIHVAHTHGLPADPAEAFIAVTAAAHNLEATLAGSGLVGDNLAASLDGARKDSLYSQVLFLFLGLPGAILAGILTAAIANAGAVRRRREQALLRTRGMSVRQVVRLAAVEALLVGVVGGAVGLGVAAAIGRFAFGASGFGASTTSAVSWTVGAFVVGLLIAVIAVLVPTVRDFRESTVTGARARVHRERAPRWMRFGLDIIMLVGAAVMFAITSQAGYSLVLAPEGVATISVSYWAFLGPALLWIGVALLAWRIAYLILGRGRPLVARAIRPLTGNLSSTAAAGLSRQRTIVARAVVLVALAVSFAASTATFNATYKAQAEVDARLTNGADIAVTQPPGSNVGPDAAAAIASVPGVIGVEPLQHRFAYVGADLQDLYGVRPATIAAATSLQDAYFQGGTAAQLIGRLAAQPDAILVSDETVKDFQLAPGDLIRLRLQDGQTRKLITVPFHYAGIAKEFPTAPHDSFFIANADYIAKATGSNAVGAFLVDTGGQNTAAVATALHDRLGAAARVTDIGSTRSAIGSSLTSVDLAGLTRVELGFALVLAAAAGGLVLALGLAERRRTFAISSVLGATGRQLRGLVLSEAVIVVAGGIIAGAVSGWLLSQMLVTVLTGVFDPPPEKLSVPWPYLATTVLVAALAIGAAALLAAQRSRRPAVETLRGL
ncbi:MAG: ABC transporter permease [Actinomycetales bacterium]|nr:ABC transporter permease [Actinomycetales bacterium]